MHPRASRRQGAACAGDQRSPRPARSPSVHSSATGRAGHGAASGNTNPVNFVEFDGHRPANVIGDAGPLGPEACLKQYGPTCYVDRGESSWGDLGDALAEATGIADLIDCARNPSLSSCALATLAVTPFGKVVKAGKIGGRVANAVAHAYLAGKGTAEIAGRKRTANAAFQSYVAKLLPGARIEKKGAGVWIATDGDKTIRLRAPDRSKTVRTGGQPKGTWTLDLQGFGVGKNKDDNFKVFFRPGKGK